MHNILTMNFFYNRDIFNCDTHNYKNSLLLGVKGRVTVDSYFVVQEYRNNVGVEQNYAIMLQQCKD